ncbi:hypothetical protein ACQKMD_08965 [Viridibacillus sp. NPDC096237]|uniref:hypothetical protein n=1 Tax=Viridibacillus sp. NPDC096237 TaxID=3390721 RepID=UPI003CFC293F
MRHWKSKQKQWKKISEKIAMEEFENVEEHHEFSKEYNLKKKIFLNELKMQGNMKRKQYKKRMRLIMAAAVLFIVVPTTTYAGVSIYSTIINKENYETNYLIKKEDKTKIAYEYVKMEIGYLPDNMVEDKDSGSMKYSYKNRINEGGLSFILWKLDGDADFSILNSLEADKIEIGNHKGVLIKKEGEFNRQVFLLFEEEGYVLETFVGDDVNNQVMEKVLASIFLVKSDKDQATPSSVYKEEAVEALKSEKLSKDSKRIFSIGSTAPVEISNRGEKHKLDFVVNNAKVMDSISQFDSKDFNDFHSDLLEESQNNSGKLPFYERETYKSGDGKNTIDELIDTSMIQKKFLYLTVTIENKEDKKISDFYFSPHFISLKDNGENWRFELETYTSDETSSEVAYLDGNGEGNSYYKLPDLEPNEKRVVHIGYFVDADQLKTAFLDIFNNRTIMENVEGNDRWWIDLRQQ